MSPSDSLQCVDGSGLPGQSQSRSGVTNQTAHVDIPFYGVVRRKNRTTFGGKMNTLVLFVILIAAIIGVLIWCVIEDERDRHD